MVNQIIETRSLGPGCSISYFKLTLGDVQIGNLYDEPQRLGKWRLYDFWSGDETIVHSLREAIDHFSRPFPAYEDSYTVIRIFQSLEQEILTAIAKKDKETASIYLSRLQEFNKEKSRRHGNLYGDLGLPAKFLNLKVTFSNHFGTTEVPVDLITQLARDNERFKLLLA